MVPGKTPDFIVVLRIENKIIRTASEVHTPSLSTSNDLNDM